jgi:hypothetical protein
MPTKPDDNRSFNGHGIDPTWAEIAALVLVHVVTLGGLFALVWYRVGMVSTP